MKQKIERRKPSNFLDYFAIAVTTFGVGYLPIAPGTWGSMVAVVIYIAAGWLWTVTGIYFFGFDGRSDAAFGAWVAVVISLFIFSFCQLGIWAAGRSTEFFGNTDPSEAVVDEVIGQLIVFLFIPFTWSWPLILSGFLLFRLFDIWKPYPIDALQSLPGGIGICADDILAGVYAGACLAIIYSVSLSI